MLFRSLPGQASLSLAAPSSAAAPNSAGPSCNRNAAALEIKRLSGQLSAVNIQIKAVEIQRSTDTDQIPMLKAGLPETQSRLDVTQHRIQTETLQIASLEKSASELRSTIARRQTEDTACADKAGADAP